jgi:hypothetical protein
MCDYLIDFTRVLIYTIRDVLPIVLLILFFQLVVLKQPIANLKKMSIGGIYVVLGLSLFLMGLEKALFPVGQIMASQLSDPVFLGVTDVGLASWKSYYWIVAIGVAFALALGTFRIVTGTPLFIYIMIGYIVVMVQTIFAPKMLIALAYDSGGVTTSTVTVPIVAALGLGLSSAVPGRNPAIDGFGLIAFASLFPIITVLGYAQFMSLKNKLLKTKSEKNAV